MPERSFSLPDVVEAVRLSADLPSALRFLSHSCPICQEQVSFSQVSHGRRASAAPPPFAAAQPPSSLLLQIITMTHCSCFLCQTCFKTFFSSAIKEKSVDQLVCPQCGKPEVRGQGGMEEVMDYFNLLDTQVSSPGASVDQRPETRCFRLLGPFVCADSPLPASRARAVPEEAQRPSPAGHARLHLVFPRTHATPGAPSTAHTRTPKSLHRAVRKRSTQC